MKGEDGGSDYCSLVTPRVPLYESCTMNGPEKAGHVVNGGGAILFPRLLMHCRQNYGFCALECKNMSEKGFKMHRSLQI